MTEQLKINENEFISFLRKNGVELFLIDDDDDYIFKVKRQTMIEFVKIFNITWNNPAISMLLKGKIKL